MIFPDGDDPCGRSYGNLRWSKFKDRDPNEMFAIVSEHAFPFLPGGGGGRYVACRAHADARLTIPSPTLLGKVDILDDIPLEDRDTKADLYK